MKGKKNNKRHPNEFRIRQIPKPIQTALANIARNSMQLKKNDFMKIKISEIVNSYPDHMKVSAPKKEKKNKRDFPEMCLCGVPKKVQDALINIADNSSGLDVNSFLLVKIYEIINSYPADMRKDPSLSD